MALLALKEAETALKHEGSLQAILDELRPAIERDARFDHTGYLVSLEYSAHYNNHYDFWFTLRWMIGLAKNRRVKSTR